MALADGTRARKGTRIAPAGFFMLRTPLLPFDDLLALGDGLTAARDDAPPRALDEDRDMVRRRLRAIVARPEVREALFLASPSLEESLPAWLDAPESARGQKVERALVKYVTRMAARATPFGLFAGCSTGKIGETTRLRIEPLERYRRHTRLDGDYLTTLTEALQRDPALRRALTFRPNSTLYRVGQRLRYVERSGEGQDRCYRLVDVESSPALERTLERAVAGARLEPLAQALVADDGTGEITLDDARGYVEQLVDAQLLVGDFEPQVTGPEPIHDLVAQLTAAASPLATLLGETRRALASIDAAPLGAPPASYRDLAGRLHALPATPELARLFQVDLFKPATEATLGPEPVAELTRAVEIIHRLTPRHADPALERFRDELVQRYGLRQVPLTEALDEESGIGFARASAAASDASPLLAGLAFGRIDEPAPPPLDALGRLLLRKLVAAGPGVEELSLDADELAPCFAADAMPLPSSISAMVTLSAPSRERLAAGDFRVWLQALVGPSGANLLARFCHGDAALTAAVQAHLRDEEAQRPEAIFAEVVHLPEGRVGNVVQRPCLREHEIAFLGRSGAPPERCLPLDDLLVSVEGRRVVLRSRRLGREIIPRLTAAHAFDSPRNLGIYRFLGALQRQDGRVLQPRWGALDALDELPRIRLGKVVLLPRRWRLGAEAPAGDAREATARFDGVQRLRRRHRLPRWVGAIEGDHVLPIDLDNALSVDVLAQLLATQPSVLVQELPPPEELCVHGPEGAFVNELIVPLLAPVAARARVAAPAPPSQLPRVLAPGSEWLTLKLYCGEAAGDRLLRDVVAGAVGRLGAAGVIDNWFFLRYADPDFHLRVRLHGDPERLLDEARPLVARAVATELCWKVQIDTYEREIERYGGDAGMLAAEQIFGADAMAVLEILTLLDDDAAPDTRWRLTLRGMDQLLDDLGLTLAEKLALVERRRDSLAREHGTDAAFDRHLGERFRRQRLTLEPLVDHGADTDHELAPMLSVLARRSARVSPVAAALREHAARRRLHVGVEELGASFLHLHANRLLPGATRAHELVLYDFLARLYRGLRARGGR